MHLVLFKPYLLRQFTIKNLCPCCTYIFKDEDKLKFSMLYTIDGNNSLKRIIRRETVPEAPEPTAQAPTTTEEMPQPVLGPSSEVKDSQTVGRGIYLTREQVNEWAKEVLTELVPGFDNDNNNPCAKHWWNMKTELTAKMWGIFEETGFFWPSVGMVLYSYWQTWLVVVSCKFFT
jgi:hypothetical protein